MTLTANNVVDAGTSATYVVVVKNITVDPASNSQDWSVSLKEVTNSNGINASAYTNV